MWACLALFPKILLFAHCWTILFPSNLSLDHALDPIRCRCVTTSVSILNLGTMQDNFPGHMILRLDSPRWIHGWAGLGSRRGRVKTLVQRFAQCCAVTSYSTILMLPCRCVNVWMVWLSSFFTSFGLKVLVRFIGFSRARFQLEHSLNAVVHLKAFFSHLNPTSGSEPKSLFLFSHIFSFSKSNARVCQT
jgi:hypothetical protein